MLELAAMGALLAISAVGCADGAQMAEEDLGEDLATATESLTDPMWTPCAKQGEVCRFEGKRRVRYGRDGLYTVGEFEGSVKCSRSSFPRAWLFRRNNLCEFDASPTNLDPAPTPEPAPEPTPTPTPTPDAGMPMDHTGHTGSGPYIDMSAIPQGSAGSSTVDIKPTSEQPVPSDIGAFRNVCGYSHMSKDDPIVFPGKPGAAHLHMFFGNTKTNASSTYDSLRNSGNSTCRGGIANRTAYWVPALVDGRGVPQVPEQMNVYYKTGYGGVRPQDVQSLPKGLRMIAGDQKATSQQQFAYWGCMEQYIGHKGSIPDCGTGNHVVMTVEFPQCWDGKNLDSPDHKSHMAYADGGCPASHPVALPVITYQIWFKQPASGTKDWRLSSDTYDASLPGGYSLHGDWFEAWDPEVSDAFIEGCDQAQVDCHSHLLGDGREIF